MASGPVSVPLDSTCHRIREWLSLEGASEGQLSMPPTQAGTSQTGCTEPSPDGFPYLQEKRFHYLIGQPVLVVSHTHSENVSPDVWRKPPVFEFVPLPLVLSLAASERSLVLSSLHFPFNYLYILVRPSLSFLFSRLNSHSILSLSL